MSATIFLTATACTLLDNLNPTIQIRSPSCSPLRSALFERATTPRLEPPGLATQRAVHTDPEEKHERQQDESIPHSLSAAGGVLDQAQRRLQTARMHTPQEGLSFTSLHGSGT